MQITSFKSIGGLNINANPLLATPGKDVVGTARTATVVADNCVLTRQKMIGNRKGFSYFTASTTNPVDAFAEYQNTLVEHESNGTMYRQDPTSGTRTVYTGSYLPPGGYRMDSTVARGSLIFTSTNGPIKLDAIANTPSRAGMQKALDVRALPTGTGGGFAGGFTKMAYHVTWTRLDANQQTIRSDVSTRTIVTVNTQVALTSLTSAANVATATTSAAHGYATGDQIIIAGASPAAYDGPFTVTVTSSTTFTYPVSGSPSTPATGTITASKSMNVVVGFTVPWDVQAGDSYEVWRTVTTAANNADPGDDCFLVAKVTNVAAAGATVNYTDTTSDAIVSASTPLYTNATQEGALQGNARPPLSTCVATYKDYAIYGNTALDYQVSENLLATVNLIAGTSSVTLNDGSGVRTYVANTTENVSTNTFQLFTGGTSNASNIQQTVQSLCHVINGDASGRWYGEYTSGPNDNPGLFRLWARNPTSGVFWLTCNNATTSVQFTPTVPTSGATLSASNDARPNRLFYSKYAQPDHVPVLNTIDAGQLSQPILRVIATRDSLFIIKSDGIYYLSGLTAPFSLTELDSTCHCLAASTAVALNNSIYMLSNQGVVQLSLSGITVISFDIEPLIMGALSFANLASTAFAVAHEADRSYILYLPTISGDTVATQALVYHIFATEWTRWTKSARAGIVLNVNYSLYLSSGLENALLKQRRAGDLTDYADEAVAFTVVSQSGTTLTVTWTASLFQPTAGISLLQGATAAKVTAAKLVTGTTWTFTLDRSVTFTPGAATGTMPVYAQIRLSPNPCGEIGILKTFYDVSFFLAGDTATQAAIELATNEAVGLNQYPITRSISGGFGTGAWGAVGWGDQPSAVRAVPWQMALPVGDQTGETLSVGWLHNVAQEQFILAQCSVSFDPLSDYVVTA